MDGLRDPDWPHGPDPTPPIRTSFRDRVAASRAWSWFAFRAPRPAIYALLALAPGLVLAAIALFGPPGMRVALTTTNHVHELYSRLAGAVATATAIAVSVAALTLRRELKGVSTTRDHHDADIAYREHVRHLLRIPWLPVGLSAFLTAVLTGIRESIHEVRESAGDHLHEYRAEDVPLDRYLDALQETTARTRRRLRRRARSPRTMIDTLVDFEFRLTEHLADAYYRLEDMPDDVRERIGDLRDRIAAFVVGMNYAKTLTLQWELSQMSIAILLTAFPSILVAAGMVLLWGPGATAFLGVSIAGLVVAAAFSIVILPLAVFGGYLLRVLFLNQFTLSTAGFGLGPEEPDVLNYPRKRKQGNPGEEEMGERSGSPRQGRRGTTEE